MPTADRHKNPMRMGGGALKRHKKQKIRITTKIGFKLVLKNETKCRKMDHKYAAVSTTNLRDF